MKKVIGWILVVCGVFSLPGFLSKLGHAHYSYEVIGIFMGQGLIYFLAYLCLRNKTSEQETNSENNITENNDACKKDESLSSAPRSTDEMEGAESSIHETPDPMSFSQGCNQTIDSSLKENASLVLKPINLYVKSTNEESIEFPRIDYSSVSWKEVEALLFEYQKGELLNKCNPSLFMNPYNHDKVETANAILIKLNDSTCLKDLKILREMALSLGVKVSTSQIYDYLKTICNPINFVGSKELFSAANNLYERILESKNNISELERILQQAEGIIMLKSNEVEIPVIVEPKEPISRSKIVLFLVWTLWTGAHIFMWAYKGILYNATTYFFPFQTTNLKKYDYTEFLVYGVAFPAVIFGLSKIISYLKNKTMRRIIFILLVSITFFCSCDQNTKLWRIQEDGLYGFVDSVGNVVIEPQYKYVGNFRSGYACVITNARLEIKETGLKNDTMLWVKYGYIDTYNNIVIDTTNIAVLKVDPSMFDFPKLFSSKKLDFRNYTFSKLDLVEDRFLFQDQKTRKFGYKNSEGEIVIPPIYHGAEPFANGRAVVRDTINHENAFKNGKFDVTIFNNCGAIDVNGNKVIKFEYAYISQFGRNKESWAYFLTQSEESETINKQWVLIDENGNVLIPPSPMCDHVYNSDEGLYVGQMNMFGIIDYTFIDKSGKFLTEYDHDGTLRLPFSEGEKSEVLGGVTAFSEGYAGIKGGYGENTVWYFANKELQTNLVPYDSLQCFSEGLAAVKQYVDESVSLGPHSGKWGFIDKKANVVIPYQFSDCGSFRGSLAYFKKWGSTYDIEGYINKQGEIVWQTKKKK